MMTDELWDGLKELSAEGLFWMIKSIIRAAKEKGKVEELRGLLCTLLRMLEVTRQIEALEQERKIINRMIENDWCGNSD